MAKKFMRKALVLIKVETPYGTDAVPAGVDAFLVKNLRITPMNAEFANRDIIRAYFGNSEQLPVGVHGMAEFEIELAGSGTANVAPRVGRVLRACAMSENTLAADATGTAAAGATRSITLAAGASAADDAYNGMRLDVTAGANAGVENYVTDYVGATKVATLAKTAGGAYGVTSVYAIRSNVQYRPVSASIESVTFLCNYDGIQHKFLGVRGSASFSLNAKGIPVAKVKLLGLYTNVVDAAAATPDYSAFRSPVVANSANTPYFVMHDVVPPLSSLDLDLANTVVFRQLIGSESVELTDREAVGKVKWEADSISFKDWFSIAKAGTLDSMAVRHGTAAGNICAMVTPLLQVKPPKYVEEDKIAMWESDVVVNPGAGVGNDETYLTFM